MTPRIQTLFFLILIMITPILAPLAHALVELESTPLDWTYSGKDLPPGYKVDITVKAEGCVLCGGLADAGFKVAGKRFGVSQDGRDVYIFFEGHQYKIDTLPWASKTQYNTVFTVRLYCPNEAPQGETPQPGYLWLEVSEHDWTHKTHYYLIPDPGPGGQAPAIYWFSESNNIITSNVHVGQVIKLNDCGYQGNPPNPGEGSSGDPYNRDDNKNWLVYGLAGATAILFLLVLVRGVFR